MVRFLENNHCIIKIKTMQVIKRIQNSIYELRGIKVIIDKDLAELYDVETKVLNQSVKRNMKRFPTDFMFQLTKEEYNILKSQIEKSAQPEYTSR